jgi:pimeloyl-ACP methyl ester carboxylesterase
MIGANGVELCAESFGDPDDAPVLPIQGIGASMLWWEEEFCRRLAAGGRFVIRYDHRDTGRDRYWEVLLDAILEHTQVRNGPKPLA